MANSRSRLLGSHFGPDPLQFFILHGVAVQEVERSRASDWQIEQLSICRRDSALPVSGGRTPPSRPEAMQVPDRCCESSTRPKPSPGPAEADTRPLRGYPAPQGPPILAQSHAFRSNWRAYCR